MQVGRLWESNPNVCSGTEILFFACSIRGHLDFARHFCRIPDAHIVKYDGARLSGSGHRLILSILHRDQRLYFNEPGNMAGPVDLPHLQARWQDVGTIPTTQFQQAMLAVMYLVAAVAYLTYGLRMYSRISSKQTGLGKHEQTIRSLVYFDIESGC